MLDRIGKLRDKATVKVNVGCGDAHQAGSINIDLHGKPDIVADSRNLPIPDASVDWLEAHHILEHFTLKDGKKVLAEWVRVLKQGGLLLITVPHIIGMINMMVNGQNIPEMWTGINMFLYGQDGPGMRHLSAYSPAYLKHRLDENGLGCEIFDWPYRPTPSFGVLACKSSLSR